MEHIIQQIQDALSEDLLKAKYRGDRPHPLYGHCYVAAEALYHLSGGSESNLTPFRARDKHGTVHWWLEDGEGRRFDPTAEQYEALDCAPPYEDGTAGGFLTRAPSSRTQTLLSRLEE